jgi:hypothetical protein
MLREHKTDVAKAYGSMKVVTHIELLGRNL